MFCILFGFPNSSILLFLTCLVSLLGFISTLDVYVSDSVFAVGQTNTITEKTSRPTQRVVCCVTLDTSQTSKNPYGTSITSASIYFSNLPRSCCLSFCFNSLHIVVCRLPFLLPGNSISEWITSLNSHSTSFLNVTRDWLVELRGRLRFPCP